MQEQNSFNPQQKEIFSKTEQQRASANKYSALRKKHRLAAEEMQAESWDSWRTWEGYVESQGRDTTT